MRLMIEIDRSTDGGRFEGTVLSGSGPVPVAFCGTLELLKILEDSTSGPASMDTADRAETGLAEVIEFAARPETRPAGELT